MTSFPAIARDKLHGPLTPCCSPEQHLPAEMLKDHMKRAKPKSCLGAETLELLLALPAWCQTSPHQAAPVSSEKCSLQTAAWTALQEESWHATKQH